MNGTNEKFVRTELLLGPDKMEKIYKSHVAVVGIGAVGTHAIEALARSGVSNFTLIDFDVIKLSNFNRQLLAVEQNIGRKKTEAAKERILSINPLANVTIIDDFCHEETLPIIFSNKPDVVIDAIDGVAPKVKLLAYLAIHRINVVSSMGAARIKDPAYIRCGDISETSVCKLAFEIRKHLRYEGVTTGIRCIYSIEPREKQLSIADPEPDSFSRGRDRKPMGSLSMITGMFGYYAALEALRIISDF